MVEAIQYAVEFGVGERGIELIGNGGFGFGGFLVGNEGVFVFAVFDEVGRELVGGIGEDCGKGSANRA